MNSTNTTINTNASSDPPLTMFMICYLVIILAVPIGCGVLGGVIKALLDIPELFAKDIGSKAARAAPTNAPPPSRDTSTHSEMPFEREHVAALVWEQQRVYYHLV